MLLQPRDIHGPFPRYQRPYCFWRITPRQLCMGVRYPLAMPFNLLVQTPHRLFDQVRWQLFIVFQPSRVPSACPGGIECSFRHASDYSRTIMGMKLSLKNLELRWVAGRIRIGHSTKDRTFNAGLAREDAWSDGLGGDLAV